MTSAYISIRKTNMAKIFVVMRMMKFWKKELLKKGPSIKFRIRNEIRNVVSIEGISCYKSGVNKAKKLVAMFCQGANTIMQVKMWTINFLEQIYRISDQM